MNKALIVVSFSVILSTISAKVAFSDTPRQKSQPAEVMQAVGDIPLCYFKTSDGKIRNLDKLCEAPKEVAPSGSTLAQNNPYDTTAIKKFDDNLYGKSDDPNVPRQRYEIRFF